MFFFKKKKKLITHNGSFHADDIFACAAISLFLEKKKEHFEVIRTRDEKIIQMGDYVFDVGGIYDPNKNRFDHHQPGGAGMRANGIPFSSFGLVWQKFGAEICNSQEIAEIIELKLIQPIDAEDNGVDICNHTFNIFTYQIGNIVESFLPTAFEKNNKDEKFFELIQLAKTILKREIKKATDGLKVKKIIYEDYKKAKDNRIIVIDKISVSRDIIWDVLCAYPEPLFAIYFSFDDWGVVTIRKNRNLFGSRKDFPKEWSGLTGEKLQKLSGVPDAIFCHKDLFLVGAKSKEGAIKLAELALK